MKRANLAHELVDRNLTTVNLIRQRERPAPAVLADRAGDHPAGLRRLKQRAHTPQL
jgi:hypothetical protein